MADNPITRKEKYLAKLTGSYTGNVPDPITRVEKYLYDLCQKGISGLTPEEIENAVNKYLKENPVQPGATTEQAQQIKQNTDDVASLKEDLSNKITKFYASSQGETHLADSDNGKIQDMMLYGRSEQKQYSGKNLLNPTLQTTTQNSVTCTANGDGTYTLNGSNANIPSVFTLGTVYLIKDKKYKMAGCPANPGKAYLQLRTPEPDNVAYKNDYSSGVEFVIPKSGKYIVRIYYDVETYNNLLFKPMLTTDLTATYDDFEPYTGGIPSPNPDYPQEIKSVVNPTVKVCGKNLLNYDAWSQIDCANGKAVYENNGVTITALRNDAFTNYDMSKFPTTARIPVNVGETITISWDEPLNKEGRVYVFGNASTSNMTYVNNSSSKQLKYTIPSGVTFITFRFGVGNAGDTISYRNIQIELGSTPTAYEPYHEQTVTLPYTLNAIPVNSGGNVTIDGQQYIADYVDVERGKLVRMCKEYVITGSERLAMYWLGNASYLRNVCCINNFENIVLYDGINPLAMSDMFIGKISENADDERAIYLMLRGSGDKTLAIKFLDSDGITTVDLAKQWLIEHKPKIVFVLSTPEEIDLTPEEIAALKALSTYYPTTNISVNSKQLDGYTVFNYPISMENGWNYVKQQIGDTRDYIYDMDARTQDTDLQAAEAYVNSEYAVALTELEVM